VDEVIRWALVDDKPEILLGTLHATNHDLYPAIYSIISILLTLSVSSATSERSLNGRVLVKSFIRAQMVDKRLSNLYTD
jgi:hypothetical protein